MQEVTNQAPAAEVNGGPDVFTVEGARAKMKMPNELQAAYVRIVEAGLKFMFDPTTRDQTIAFMEKPGEPAKKLGDGVASVMGLLFKESNQTLPPQLIIPCGIELLMHAAAVAKSGGMEFDKNTMAEAMAIMIDSVSTKFGVNQSTGGMLSSPAEDGGNPAAHERAEPTQEKRQEYSGNQGGLIQGAMR